MNPDETTWEARRSALLRLADERLDNDHESPRLVGEIAGWFRRLLDDMPQRADRDMLTHRPSGQATLPETLRDVGLPDWGRDVETLVSDAAPVMTVEPLAAERALGRALGLVVGTDPDERTFDLVSTVTEQFHDAYGAFWHSAKTALAGNATASQKLHAMVLRRANDFTSAPRHAVYLMSRVNPCALVEDYALRARLRDVWCNSPYSAQIRLRHPATYGLLLQLDPSSWLDAVERFPAPEPVAEIVRRCHLDREHEGLSNLIRQAVSPFRADGEWRRENKVVFHLLQAAESLLAHLAGPASQGGDPLAFSETLHQITDALRARPDASALGHAWLEEIAWKDYASGAWRIAGETPAVPDALARLFAAVAEVTPPLPSPIAWVEGEDDVWQRDRLLAVVAVARARAITDELGTLMREAAERGLGARTAHMISDGPTLAAEVLGGAIASLPNPATWLHQLWNATFPLRDRARHLSYQRENNHTDINITCVSWGIAALERSPSGSPVTRAIWIQVLEMIREAYITHAIDAGRDLARAQRRLASLWLPTFPQAPRDGAPGSLAHFLSSFQAADLDFMSTILTLEEAGVQPNDIASAAGGKVALRELVSAVLDDAKREGHRPRNRRAEELLEAFLTRL